MNLWYCELSRFRGICYRAAGWTYVGSTRGRGRQDFNREQKLAVKDIFVYPLAKGWQRRLCRVPPRKKVKTQEAEDNESQNDVRQHWVEREFWDTPLADKRLIARLIIVVNAFWKCPQGSLLQACSGSEAKVRAAYRFLKNNVVTMEKVLRPHIASTVERIRTEHKRKVVLAIQDTTTLNYTTHLQTDGLGYIGTTAEGAQGFFVHDTLALTPDGLALGLLDVQAWARDNNKFGKKKSPNRSIEAKESIKWLKSFESVAEAQRLLPETKLVSVADREGDVFELFSLARSRRDHPELLVRAEYDRCIEYRGKRQKLLAAIGSKPVECYQMIDVPRKSARRGKQGQAARQANLAIRFAEIYLLPPQRLAKSELPLQVWVVQALEEKPPSNIEPLHWLLLSTMPVTNALEAQEKIDWYRCRFLIEVYHKTFKSGCGIEERQHHRLHSLKNALALDMVVAWRIMYLMGLGRSTPNVPCTVIFEKHEWQAMYGFLHETTCVPKETPSLSEAMGMVAKLGGFLGRKGDGEPGITSAWKGLTRLEDISTAWRIFRLKEKL